MRSGKWAPLSQLSLESASRKRSFRGTLALLLGRDASLVLVGADDNEPSASPAFALVSDRDLGPSVLKPRFPIDHRVGDAGVVSSRPRSVRTVCDAYPEYVNSPAALMRRGQLVKWVRECINTPSTVVQVCCRCGKFLAHVIAVNLRRAAPVD